MLFKNLVTTASKSETAPLSSRKAFLLRFDASNIIISFSLFEVTIIKFQLRSVNVVVQINLIYYFRFWGFIVSKQSIIRKRLYFIEGQNMAEEVESVAVVALTDGEDLVVRQTDGTVL